jgi:hypothetical protein
MLLIALGTAWALNSGDVSPTGSETASAASNAPGDAVADAGGLRAQIGDLEKRVAVLERRMGEKTPDSLDGASNEDQVKGLGSRVGKLEDKANEAPASASREAPKPAASASDAASGATTAATNADASAPVADAKPAIRNVTPDAGINPQAAQSDAVNEGDNPAVSGQADADAADGDVASSETASTEDALPASLAPTSPVPPALPQPRPQFAARSLDNGNGFLTPPPSRATYDRPYGNRYAEPEQRDVVLRGWSVRDVFQGMALLQTSDGLGMIRVRPGDVLPNGGGRITSIRRLPTGWAVMTTRGIITEGY